MSEVYIFHETQDAMLCGQHCLNNLVQQSIFNPVNLSAIANELDQAERSLIHGSSASTESGINYYCTF